jgi:hypothetical protein
MADYSFDRVYGPGESTSALYDESVRGVVGCFVEGYHGSVFAYGQVRVTGWVGGGEGVGVVRRRKGR